MNISKLQKSAEKGAVYLIENPLNLRYFTDSPIDTGCLVISANAAYFITDFRYIEVAEKSFKDSCITVVLQSKLSENIKEIMSSVGANKLFIESEYQTLSKLDFFKKITENTVCDNTLDRIITELRSIKSPEEINNIKSAQKLTDEAFSYAKTIIREGLSERDLALEIEFFMRKNGAEGVSFDLISICGENTSLPHGVPFERKIKNGDFVTMDIGCKVNGYCSDMTRTVAVGFATDEMKSVYSTVLAAQKKALGTVKAGINASEVDRAARDLINSAGYEGCFGHATGHGVGLFIHEAPTVSASSKTVLKPGMVITIEPGIYLNSKFGVRIEDMAVVTESGCINLTRSPKELEILR